MKWKLIFLLVSIWKIFLNDQEEYENLLLPFNNLTSLLELFAPLSMFDFDLNYND